MSTKPWVAAVLNGVLPGAGYLYLKRRKVFSLLLIPAVLLTWYWSFTDPQVKNYYGSSVLILATVLLEVAFIVDAYTEAKS